VDESLNKARGDFKATAPEKYLSGCTIKVLAQRSGVQ
jgi:hypothetical protein